MKAACNLNFNILSLSIYHPLFDVCTGYVQ